MCWAVDLDTSQVSSTASPSAWLRTWGTMEAARVSAITEHGAETQRAVGHRKINFLASTGNLLVTTRPQAGSEGYDSVGEISFVAD